MVAFLGCIALAPMAVTGADLPPLERSANAKDCPKTTFTVAGSKHRAGCEPTFAKDVVNAEIDRERPLPTSRFDRVGHCSRGFALDVRG